jgi:hypothetical protein
MAKNKEDNMSEWKNKGICDDVYYVKEHLPCGTEVMVLIGHSVTCPKCQPEDKNPCLD